MYIKCVIYVVKNHSEFNKISNYPFYFLLSFFFFSLVSMVRSKMPRLIENGSRSRPAETPALARYYYVDLIKQPTLLKAQACKIWI